MKIYDFNTLPSNTGLGIFIYGPTGVGKTTSILQTAPLPIFYLLAENRDISQFVTVADRPELFKPENFKAGYYEGIEDLFDFFGKSQKSLSRFNAIIIDGFTHLCTMSLSFEIAQETFESMDAKGKVNANNMISSQVRMAQADYGTLERSLMRLTEMITKYVQQGKVVIFISLIEENPKYDKSLTAAPSFMGQQYGRKFPGEFDLIGMVEPRPIKEGKIYANWERQNGYQVWPPLVNFNSPNATFMAKWTGQPISGPKPLHIGKLLELSKTGKTDWGSNHQEEEKESIREPKQEKEVEEQLKEEVKEEVKQDEFD